MRQVTLKTLVLWVVVGGLVSPVTAAVTTESLLDEMVDLGRLAKLADPTYTTKQFSSYDRGSKSHSDHAGWFANADCGHYLRIEERAGRKEHVMMDTAGPGAIVRVWSANPKGTLRVYLDGSETPVIEAEMGKLLGGVVPGLPKPLAGQRSRGWNLYFPIPYARSCKVTSDEGGFYYHVNYRTYDQGTQVKSFTPDDLKRLADKVNDIARRLSSPRAACDLPAERTKQRFDATLSPNAAATLWEMSGAKEICGFLVHLEAEDVAAAARSVVLSMSFDGEQTVQSPIGDFFGTAPGLIPYASLPLGITKDNPQQMWCHWRMPFSSSAEISVTNLGEQSVRVHGGVAVMPYDWDDRSLLFHAKWRIERNVPSRPMTDWVHLACRGNGRFVGGALHVVNPVRNWWGEGDEKIYVDGEAFPSHFGTGTEDYYGYAWCCPLRFVHAYHSQPNCDGPGNYGNTSVNRFHIIDDIPFTRSFKFDIENWHSHDRCDTTRAAVSYWYARPKGSDFFGPVTRDQVEPVEVPEYQLFRVAGAIEGEKMEVIEKTGTTAIQNLGPRFSGEAHLWWTEGQPGDRLTLGFNVPADTRKHVLVKLTKAPDYATVQLYVNGEKAGDVIDLYNSRGVASGEMDLGPFDLTQGQNKLTVEIIGANEQAIKAYMFGLDYVLLK